MFMTRSTRLETLCPKTMSSADGPRICVGERCAAFWPIGDTPMRTYVGGIVTAPGRAVRSESDVTQELIDETWARESKLRKLALPSGWFLEARFTLPRHIPTGGAALYMVEPNLPLRGAGAVLLRAHHAHR